MMKHFIISLITIFLSCSLHCQTHNDRFDSYDSMLGMTIRMFSADIMAEHQGYYAYELRNNQFKLVKEIRVYQNLNNSNITVHNIIEKKGRKYLHIKSTTRELYLILDASFNYINNIRSCSYWDKYLTKINSNYKFINSHSKLLKGKTLDDNDTWLPISWKEHIMPTNINGEVMISFTLGTPELISDFFTIKDIEENRDDFFMSKPEHKDSEVLFEDKTSLISSNNAYNENVGNSVIIEARVKNNPFTRELLKDYDIILNSDDNNLKMTVYNALLQKEKDDEVTYYQGYILNKEVVLPEHSLIFRNNLYRDYLNKQKTELIIPRKNSALRYNQFISQIYLDSLYQHNVKLQEEKQRRIRNYIKNETLITNQIQLNNNGLYGLEFDLFNCYNKTIKTITMTIKAYDVNGEEYPDSSGRSSKEIDLKGPIEQSQEQTYSFDDLFRDPKGNIYKLIPTSLKIIFSDYTTLRFDNQSHVDSLRPSNN